MTATPYPPESFGMQQMRRRYAPSATRLAKATSHAAGHAPAPAYVATFVATTVDMEGLHRLILAPYVRTLPPQEAAEHLDSEYAAVREAAMFAVCAPEAK
jgi:hypothetical protein